MKASLRTVFVSCGVTLAVMGTTLCAAAVDINCRWIGFGDGHTLYLDELRPAVKQLGPVYFATDVWYHQFVELVCPESLEE